MSELLSGEGRFRTRHIRFCVTSAATRLNTQMYFEGEPMNETDIILPWTENNEDPIARLACL